MMAAETSGMLFLRRDVDKVRAQLADVANPTVVRQIGDQWGAFFIDSDDYTSEGVKAIYRQMAFDAPLLHFAQAADGRWEYTIFAEGAELAHAELNGGAADGAEGAKETYPEAERAAYAARDLRAFLHFGLSEEQLSKLAPFVASEYELPLEQQQNAIRFLQTLGAEGILGQNFIAINRANPDAETGAADTL